MDGLTLGVDISVYQDANETPARVDFAKMRRAGVKFVIIRAAFGATQDEDFAYNWSAAKQAGLIRGAYCFWDYRPGAPGIAAQIARWMAILGPDAGDLPIAIDVEKANENWPDLPARSVCLDAISRFDQAARRLTGRAGMLYTNPAAIRARLTPAPDWLLSMPLWVAHWYAEREKIGYQPWPRWAIWQQGLGKAQGLTFGVESKDIDIDYFNGDEKALLSFAGLSHMPPAAEEPEEEEEPMTLYEKNARGVFVWETHVNSDFSALAGKIDFVVCYAGHGDEEAANFRENIAAARKIGVPVLAYVTLKPDLYQGMGYDPSRFPKGLAEKHVRMLRDALHYDSGKSESIDGVIFDASDYVMEDGKTELTPTWAGALIEHITNELFAYFKKPVYPLVKPGFAARYKGEQAVVLPLTRLGSVSCVNMAANLVAQDGYNLPADREGPRPPFIEKWDFWWYGAQTFGGLNKVSLWLSSKTRFALWKELGYAGAPVQPPVEEPEEPQEPPAGEGGRVEKALDSLLACVEEMRADLKRLSARVEAGWTITIEGKK